MNHLSSSRLLKPLVILQPQAGSAGVLRHGGRGMTALGREIEGSNPRCRKVRLASNKEVTGETQTVVPTRPRSGNCPHRVQMYRGSLRKAEGMNGLAQLT